MVRKEYIITTLNDLFPSSQKITTGYINEVEAAFANASQDDFDAAIRKHRNGPQAQYVPLARELSRSVSVKASYSPGRLAKLFFHSLVIHGWNGGVRRAMHFQLGYANETNEAMRTWLIQCNITESATQYYGLPEWQTQFLDLLHGGKVTDAHQWMADFGPQELKKANRDKADNFRVMGDENAKGYFHYFKTPKRRFGEPLPANAAQWLKDASAKLAAKQKV